MPIVLHYYIQCFCCFPTQAHPPYTLTLSPLPPSPPSAVPSLTGSFSPPPRLAFANGLTVDAGDPSREVPLKGLNFFGFNNGQVSRARWLAG